MGVEVTQHQRVRVEGEEGGECVLRKGVTWAAGCRREVEVENVEGRVPDSDGDAVHLQELVAGVYGELGVGDGVVD